MFLVTYCMRRDGFVRTYFIHGTEIFWNFFASLKGKSPHNIIYVSVRKQSWIRQMLNINSNLLSFCSEKCGLVLQLQIKIKRKKNKKKTAVTCMFKLINFETR